MRRQIHGGNPDMNTRYFVGRCVSSGIVRIIDLQRACEYELSIRQMSRVAKNAPSFGLQGGGLFVSKPFLGFSGSYITFRTPGMYLEGVMSDDLEVAFGKFFLLMKS